MEQLQYGVTRIGHIITDRWRETPQIAFDEGGQERWVLPIAEHVRAAKMNIGRDVMFTLTEPEHKDLKGYGFAKLHLPGL